MKSLSRVRLFATPWSAAYQAPLSMGFFQASVLEWGAIAFSSLGPTKVINAVLGPVQYNMRALRALSCGGCHQDGSWISARLHILPQMT